MKTTDGQYFVVRNIPGDKLELVTTDIQNGVIQNASTARVELHRNATQLAIVFIRESKKFLLTAQKQNENASLELKDVTDRPVQQEDYYFKYKNLGAVDYFTLSTVEIREMYIYTSVESVVSLTSKITRCVHVKAEVA